MISYSPLDKANQRGSILPAALIGILSLVVVTGLLGVREFRAKVTNYGLRADIAQAQLSSSIETMVLAYRFAEMRYVQAVANCASAKNFLRALREGSGCDTGMSVTVFAGDDPGSVVISGEGTKPLYQYASAGCTITESSSSCATGSRQVLVRIGGGSSETLNQTQYDMKLVGPEPGKNVLQMVAEITPPDGRKISNDFAIRGAMPNFAHQEVGSRVTQENPDPLSKCPGTAWGDLLVFEPTSATCKKFGQLGGGTGLAYYNYGFFGMRPADGQVVDLLNLGLGIDPDTYMVNEDGTIGGRRVFPPYRKELLVNVDDFTTSASQIQLVSGVGESAAIDALGYDAGGTMVRTTVCTLGDKGWAQSYSGIAAANWNDPLLPKPAADASDVRLAMFALKTDNGNSFTAAVTATQAGYECVVFKDSAQQVEEYRRTTGFDRTNDVLPYYIY